ncbi:biotin-independent malonate decarboxylase subunit gamma [Methylobacterium sp. WL30]|uniref:biotin-independent malonate decarboxylase subunit gamma n=1 Tax=unclassified Methylobacterium TaxID=2615210 RepID=UPI0011CBEF32|nr:MULTISPECIES: biotin-independent malonate decarboxylase subunit gamma [unclassified Methylobacterium]TXM93267.1 biotin-independent malonate decarboxylase subunit gamma [Methylobacterium sp. WL116]TXN34557.1 biotin-independent malonate decarboxylase subunit gamma [Methylobacterium sp. WL93]TXN45975.1 biotin-independent malonate decarboxylase subunit gamma [Methylobacterium sp. WL119]TXN65999.1 biotin-independent malonate decarboxylase subunit gamma [Methylobacterium sp. WL30]
MTLAEILASLFPVGHAVAVADGLITGRGPLENRDLAVVGVDGDTPLGIEGALALSAAVLATVRAGGATPVLVLVDSDSQRMSRRDELLGLNECLAHLAKALLLADAQGHPTIGLIYGHSAAGAFIATALATRVLVALPGANPSVMDLPSVARVTKLPLEKLEAMAKSTPVFAPGLDNMVQAGAVQVVLDPAKPLGPQIAALIGEPPSHDARDALGKDRGGRPVAHDIAARVVDAARA